MMAENNESNISENTPDSEEEQISSPKSDNLNDQEEKVENSEQSPEKLEEIAVTSEDQKKSKQSSPDSSDFHPSEEKRKLTPLEKAMKKLSSRQFRDKNEGIKMLAKVKDPKAAEKLSEIVKNERMNERLRVNALDSLSRGKRDPAFKRFLQDLAGNTKNPPEIRRSAITHLSRFRDPKLIPTFTSALKDPYRFIRFWAVRGLIKIDDPKATAGLIQALGDDDEEIRKEVMAHLEAGKQISFPVLVKAVQNPESDKFLRYGALGLIGRMEHPDRVSVLIKALSDEDNRIITIALRGLGKTQDPQAVKPLLDLYRKNVRKRRLIEDALYRIGQSHQKEIIDALVPLLMDEDEALVKLSRNLLSKFNKSYQILGDMKESGQIDPALKEKIQEIMKSI